MEDTSWGERVDSNEGVVNATPRRGSGEEKKRGWRVWRKKVEEEDGGVKGNAGMGLTAFLLKFGEGLGESHRDAANVD